MDGSFLGLLILIVIAAVLYQMVGAIFSNAWFGLAIFVIVLIFIYDPQRLVDSWHVVFG